MKFKKHFHIYKISAQGFTVLETLVVISILLILTSLSILAFTGFQKDLGVKNGATEINAIFQAARMNAISKKQYFQVAIYFDTANRDKISYWIDEIDSAGAIKTPKIITPKQIPDLVTITDITLFKKLTNTTTVYTAPQGVLIPIVFQPDGTSDMATIHLIQKGLDENNSANYYTVILFSPTAKPKIFPKEKK